MNVQEWIDSHCTMNIEEWKRWIVSAAYDNHGQYWTMTKTPLPLREQAVDELAAEGKLRLVAPANESGYIEWRLEKAAI